MDWSNREKHMAFKPPRSNYSQASGPAQQASTGEGPISRTVRSLGIVGMIGWVLVGIGLLLLSIGYFRVSGNPDPSFQLRVMSAETASGLCLTAIGGILVVSTHYQRFVREYRAYRAERAGAPASPDLWTSARGAPGNTGRVAGSAQATRRRSGR